MSYINKPGKTAAWRRRVIRQQTSSAIAIGYLVTTKTRAKTTQKYLEKIVTIAKQDTVFSRRKVASFLLPTNDVTRKALVQKLFTKIAPKFLQRPGGYTQVIKLGPRLGDGAETAILKFVE